MDPQQLHETLRQLHAELERAEAVDDESRELLRSLVADIQAVLDRPARAPGHETESLGERLREAMQRFEVSHPALSAAVEQVLNTLSGAGI